MSFTYRPTPVIVLSGKTVGDDHVPLRRLPAGTMHGYVPNQRSQALNSIGRRTLKGDPWILSSGTMGRFVLGDDSSGLDFTSVPPPDFSSLPIDTTSVDITGGLVAPPTPQISAILTAPVDFTTQNAPITGGLVAPTISPISISSQGVYAQPPASFPGQAQADIAAGTSLLTSISNFFKPTVKPTPMTAAMPGVYNATTVTPSWFGQSTPLPGTPNSTVLFGGVALLVLFAVMAGGKK